MGLDIYLKGAEKVPYTGSGIWIRESGRQREITRAEWDARHPGREPVIYKPEDGLTDDLWHGQITHNLMEMATQCGLLWCLWYPDRHGLTKAGQLTEHLAKGLAYMIEHPARLRRFNPECGYGTYETLFEFTEDLLEACTKYPDADVFVSR